MGGQGGQSLEDVQKDIQRRDFNDSSRTLAPLKPAQDAIIIDSTDLTIEQVVELMLAHVSRIILI
jgi:cytidylate kinase